MVKRLTKTLIGATALALLLTGCTVLPAETPAEPKEEKERRPSLLHKEKEVPQIDTESLTPILVDYDPNVPTQVNKDLYGAEAAKELITIHINLLAQGRYQEVCDTIYSPDYRRKAIEVADGYQSKKSCPDALKESFDYAKTIDPLNNQLTPFYYVPKSYGIAEELLEVDSDIMVYIPMITVHAIEKTTFRDTETDNTPGWLTLGGYAVKLADGTWRFVTSPERTTIEKWEQF